MESPTLEVPVNKTRCGVLLTLILCANPAHLLSSDLPPFAPLDIFELEWAADPQISPDGKMVVYVRRGFDVANDRGISRLWTFELQTTAHRPLIDDTKQQSSPRWSPDGKRIAYLADGQLYVKHLDGAREVIQVTRGLESPSNISWSPDGAHIAFGMNVAEKKREWVRVPSPPKGASWAEPAQVIDRLVYRIDGAGYVEGGFEHVFVVPSEGGTPRQLTTGDYQHRGTPEWSDDCSALYVSANRNDDWEYQPTESEIWRVDVKDGAMQVITTRKGPDTSPRVSPDGKWLAYLGHDESPLGYRADHLYVLPLEGGKPQQLATELDRSIEDLNWSADAAGIYFAYDDEGNRRIAYLELKDPDQVKEVADNVGGTTMGRPYSSGSYSVSTAGEVVFSHTTPLSPAELALTRRGSKVEILTDLNGDLLPHRALGRVEEIRVPSSFDGRSIHAWVVYPPEYDPTSKHPLILEIHGGPFANYGGRFSAEMQLFAAEGNIVLYANPRGSTSYGAEFANLIHHAYPGNDYDDLMSCVDAVIAQGGVDPEQLFVTGGSGGGVLTAWIVGKTDRFRAAVVAKPVINWTSFVLTADFSKYFTEYWFPGDPWEHPKEYFERSPLSLVGNVKTPTMLLTGEDDYRTPMSETEQYYQALKLRRIPTAMVRIPGTGHGIAARPSNLIRKVAYILGWFDQHRDLP